MFEQAKKGTAHKYTEDIKNIVGGRLTPYNAISELKDVMKTFNCNSGEANKLSDIYVSMHQCEEIISSDVTRKLNELINK